MTIGIIVAIPPEFKVLKDQLDLEIVKEKPYKTATAKIGKTDAIIVESGIGKVSGAGATQYIIDNYMVSSIVNLGIGAGIDSSMKLGDVVVSNKFIQWDFHSGFYHKEENWHPTYKGVVLKTATPKEFPATPVIVATGDRFLDCEKTRSTLVSRGIGFIDMEAGAIAQVCLLNNIPFVTIKGVSDNGTGLSKNFKEDVKTAMLNSVEYLLKNLA